MADVLLIALVVAFFALAAAYVKGCERIIDADSARDAAKVDR